MDTKSTVVDRLTTVCNGFGGDLRLRDPAKAELCHNLLPLILRFHQDLGLRQGVRDRVFRKAKQGGVQKGGPGLLADELLEGDECFPARGGERTLHGAPRQRMSLLDGVPPILLRRAPLIVPGHGVEGPALVHHDRRQSTEALNRGDLRRAEQGGAPDALPLHGGPSNIHVIECHDDEPEESVHRTIMDELQIDLAQWLSPRHPFLQKRTGLLLGLTDKRKKVDRKELGRARQSSRWSGRE